METAQAISLTAQKLGYSPLKTRQEECLTQFPEGNDVLCILPTGFGKTACFAHLPYA